MYDVGRIDGLSAGGDVVVGVVDEEGDGDVEDERVDPLSQEKGCFDTVSWENRQNRVLRLGWRSGMMTYVPQLAVNPERLFVNVLTSIQIAMIAKVTDNPKMSDPICSPKPISLLFPVPNRR